MSMLPLHFARTAAPIVVGAVALLAGCASVDTAGKVPPVAATPAAASASGAGPGGATPGLRAPGAPTVAAAPSALRPFAEIVRDAKRSDGTLIVWQKDDRVWLELKPEDLDTPFFISTKLKTGIGEANFFGGLMEDSGIVEFRRIHNQIQLIWLNVGYLAKAGTPEARSVAASYSPSLLASAPVLSQPEPTRKSILVEANAMFMADLIGLGLDLQRTYRQGYSFDPRNSAITQVRTGADVVELDVLSHFATGAISVPSPILLPGVPMPSVPRSLPDPRSMFLTVHYSLARLPAEPMRGRRADARVGYFETGRLDFSDDLQRTPRLRYVNRWRLEKKDPEAALSEPVRPITYWIDRTVPFKYRPAITAGVLEWNKAFEKIGFKNAIRVEVQADDAAFDTLDFGHASIRWLTDASPAFAATGPSHVDPRSGEILDADIGIESLSSRTLRSQRSQILSAVSFDDPFPLPQDSAAALMLMKTGRACIYGDIAADQMAYAGELYDARGDLDPGSPEAEQFVEAFLKNVTMHEVGHTLGLRHNFRASRVYTQQQLADPAFTKANGIAGSVMEYAP